MCLWPLVWNKSQSELSSSRVPFNFKQGTEEAKSIIQEATSRYQSKKGRNVPNKKFAMIVKNKEVAVQTIIDEPNETISVEEFESCLDNELAEQFFFSTNVSSDDEDSDQFQWKWFCND